MFSIHLGTQITFTSKQPEHVYHVYPLNSYIHKKTCGHGLFKCIARAYNLQPRGSEFKTQKDNK